MLYFSNSKFNVSFTITEDIYTLSYRSHISTNSCASRLQPELFQPTSPFLSIRTLARESSLLFPALPARGKAAARRKARRTRVMISRILEQRAVRVCELFHFALWALASITSLQRRFLRVGPNTVGIVFGECSLINHLGNSMTHTISCSFP